MQRLSIEVTATDITMHAFIPQMLLVDFGKADIETKTLEIKFELRDNREYDTGIYLTLERIQIGSMLLPLDVAEQLVNVDGSFNLEVFNAALAPSYLQINKEVKTPVQSV